MTVWQVARRSDTLGEGMMWLPDQERIAWVDILGKAFMTAAPDGSDVRTYPQPSEIGAVLPSSAGELILVRRREVVAFDEASEDERLIWSADDMELMSNRFNDATVDPAGNLWISSMDFDAKAQTGALWRLTPGGSATKQVEGFKCLNGPAVSNDGRVLYLGDTMEGEVLSFDLDLFSGKLSNRKVFVDLKPFGGLCDGMTIDSEGNVWICQITAGRIGCYNPEGDHIYSLALPVPMITSCCFGGPELRDLYITTARILLDDADLAAYPESGSLFAALTGVVGLPPNMFGSAKKDILT
ncbi:SMP-30/gluconolactonase/LRE family protein [Falsihalocynthiibacter sp. SS001]|uniref:SMP-30/gluconolactonase/LRE family protein n=1 Tax=Falsihalocynthiibacter sp. SS001 TaxID=3349698 RepID=UPI0036D33BDF